MIEVKLPSGISTLSDHKVAPASPKAAPTVVTVPPVTKSPTVVPAVGVAPVVPPPGVRRR